MRKYQKELNTVWQQQQEEKKNKLLWMKNEKRIEAIVFVRVCVCVSYFMVIQNHDLTLHLNATQ